MTPESSDRPGMGAGVPTAASRAPQLVKTRKTRSAGGRSLTMYAVLYTGFLLRRTYGIMAEDIPIIWSNVVSPAPAAGLPVFRFGGA